MSRGSSWATQALGLRGPGANLLPPLEGGVPGPLGSLSECFTSLRKLTVSVVSLCSGWSPEGES